MTPTLVLFRIPEYLILIYMSAPLLSAPDFKPALDRALNHLFDDALTTATSIDDAYVRLLRATRDTLLLGGKRLRPYISYLAYTGLGGRHAQAFIAAAASQELLHHFLLIHDDIIDRDFMRHGAPNVQALYRDHFTKQGLSPDDALHYAQSFALMAGNAACALGLQAISQSDFPAQTKLDALHCVQHMLFEIMGGELMDVDITISGAPPTESRLLAISHYKTATYSFQTPLQFGAILANAPAAAHDQLREFGHSLGIAFQLTDDLLGVYGDEAKLGKPVTSDLREGKHTLLIHAALKLATPAQAKQLTSLWGKRDATTHDLETVRDLLSATGAQAQTSDLAQSHLRDALATLDAIPLTPPAKAELTRIAHFCVGRSH